MTGALPASFYRAEASWLNPPEERDPPRVQIEGSLYFRTIEDLADINTGELEFIGIIDSGFDPETGLLRISITGWLDCDTDGDYNLSDIGDLKNAEVVDSENVDYGPDPDEAWDNREF